MIKVIGLFIYVGEFCATFFYCCPKNYIKAYFRIYLYKNLSLSMFLGCSYFFIKSEADVLINSVLRQNTACRPWSLERIVFSE